ncbi:hypothetical protein, partial [Rhizobium phaseoli]|uniref:hypothetical protein n=1 Tax=Rhizobium phaseoli TaxID=396 RepID=UPI001AEDCAC5
TTREKPNVNDYIGKVIAEITAKQQTRQKSKNQPNPNNSAPARPRRKIGGRTPCVARQARNRECRGSRTEAAGAGWRWRVDMTAGTDNRLFGSRGPRDSNNDTAIAHGCVNNCQEIKTVPARAF